MSGITADLSGCTALVTGASSGLGAHFAQVLSNSGAHVILAARRQDALESVADTIHRQGGRCTTAHLDMTDSDSIAMLGESLAEVDILVNNAGIAREASALSQTEMDWDVVMDTNLKGLFLLAQAAARAMQAASRGGSIINIASILGLRQGGGVLPYAVSKAGVVQMTKVLALELARFDIRVNAIAPGYFATEINAAFWESDAGRAMMGRIPQRRLGQLTELDGPLLLLASDASRYITGSVLVVDGGHMVSGL
jgi:NAD(P)-dependent dehydrogenase (short-subunit alcohol dehydrogenase family)